MNQSQFAYHQPTLSKFQSNGYSYPPNGQTASKLPIPQPPPHFNSSKLNFPPLSSPFYQSTKLHPPPPHTAFNPGNPPYYPPQFPNYPPPPYFSNEIDGPRGTTIIRVPQRQSTAIPGLGRQIASAGLRPNFPQTEIPTSFNNCSFYYSGISQWPRGSQDETPAPIPRTAKSAPRKGTMYFGLGKSCYSKHRPGTRRKEDAEKFKTFKQRRTVQNSEKSNWDSCKMTPSLDKSENNDRLFNNYNVVVDHDLNYDIASPKSILTKSFKEDRSRTMMRREEDEEYLTNKNCTLSINEKITNLKSISSNKPSHPHERRKVMQHKIDHNFCEQLRGKLESLARSQVKPKVNFNLNDQHLSEHEDYGKEERQSETVVNFIKKYENKGCSCNLLLTPSNDVNSGVAQNFCDDACQSEQVPFLNVVEDDYFDIVELLSPRKTLSRQTSHLIMEPLVRNRGRRRVGSKTQSGPLLSIHTNPNDTQYYDELGKMTHSMLSMTGTKKRRQKTPTGRQSRKMFTPKFIYSFASKGQIKEKTKKLSDLWSLSKDDLQNFAEHNYCVMPLTVCVRKQCVSPCCSPCRPCTPTRVTVWQTFQTPSCNVGCGPVYCPCPCPPPCCPCPRPCCPPPVPCRPVSCCPGPCPVPPPNRATCCDPPPCPPRCPTRCCKPMCCPNPPRECRSCSPCQMACSRSCSPCPRPCKATRSCSPCSFVCAPTPPCCPPRCCPKPVCCPPPCCPKPCCPPPCCPKLCCPPPCCPRKRRCCSPCSSPICCPKIDRCCSPCCPPPCPIPCCPPPCPPRCCKPRCCRPRRSRCCSPCPPPVCCPRMDRCCSPCCPPPCCPPRPPPCCPPRKSRPCCCCPNNNNNFGCCPPRSPAPCCDPCCPPDPCIPPPCPSPCRKKRRRKRRCCCCCPQEHRALPQTAITRVCPCTPGCLCPGTLCACVPSPVQCQPQCCPCAPPQASMCCRN